MITPAARMKNAVIAPSTIRMIQNSVEASRNASRLRPCCSSSVKTGTNAADSAASANRLRTRFGIWKAIVNAEDAPGRAEEARGDDLADEAGDAREARGDREDRGVAGTPIRRSGVGAADSSPMASALTRRAAIVRRAAAAGTSARAFVCSWPTSTHRRSASCAPSASASRTAATRRRSRRTSAASRPRSTAATTTPPRPSTASSSRTIDKAVKRGALHRNTGARKKSRAARVRRGA